MKGMVFKMKFKKLFAAVAAGLMMSFLAACGSTSGFSEETSADTFADTASADTSAAENSAAAAGEDNSDKILKVGVKDAVIGFGYKDPLSGEYSGLEIELAKKIADSLGYKDVEFTTVTAATRTELLDSGDLDCVLATFTITDERRAGISLLHIIPTQ